MGTVYSATPVVMIRWSTTAGDHSLILFVTRKRVREIAPYATGVLLVFAVFFTSLMVFCPHSPSLWVRAFNQEDAQRVELWLSDNGVPSAGWVEEDGTWRHGPPSDPKTLAVSQPKKTGRLMAWAIKHGSHGLYLDALVFLPEGDAPETKED